MHQPDEITVWLNRLEQQPDDAMQKIWEAYFEKLVRYAHRKLGGMPRRSGDEEDIAAAAINSFYQAAKDNRFPDLNNREDLWKLLLTITARKAGKEIRGHLAQKRGGGGVRGESVFVTASGEQNGVLELAAEPTERFSELFVDELLVQLDQLGDARLREITVHKLEGHTNAEIAKLLDCTERTVERKLRRIRTLWDEA